MAFSLRDVSVPGACHNTSTVSHPFRHLTRSTHAYRTAQSHSDARADCAHHGHLHDTDGGGKRRSLRISPSSPTKIGSPAYQTIMSEKDFLADILPPPLFPLEPMLEVHLLFDNPSEYQHRADRIAHFHKLFNERVDSAPRVRARENDGSGGLCRLLRRHDPHVQSGLGCHLEKEILPAVKAEATFLLLNSPR